MVVVMMVMMVVVRLGRRSVVKEVVLISRERMFGSQETPEMGFVVEILRERYHGRCGQCEILYVKCQQRVLMLRHRASSRFGPGCSGGDARSDATAARRVVLIYEDASNISRRNSVFMENPVFEFVEGEGAAPQTFLQLVDGQLQPSSGIEPSFTYMGSDMSTKSRSIAQITTLTRPL
ncbi:hypothetical protein BDZ45DRAFT_695976 [Acephala macrosclerotiorum]|nr:hypothetical protein BDZ45DRAFT_695976 [Acephala macrosclerotiorum]